VDGGDQRREARSVDEPHADEVRRRVAACVSRVAHTVGVSQYADAGLTTGESYTYRVRARNAVGNSAYSAPDTVVVAPPTAPDSLQASTISGTHVALSWRDNSTTGSALPLLQRVANLGQQEHLGRRAGGRSGGGFG